jgi:hypothetical protein
LPGAASARPVQCGNRVGVSGVRRRATETAIADVGYRIGIRKQRLAQIDAWLKKQQD